MADKKEEAVVEKSKKAVAKKENERSYADLLESRAQRGKPTHQKAFVIEQMKKKEAKNV